MIEKLLDYQLRERIAKEAYDKLLAERDALKQELVKKDEETVRLCDRIESLEESCHNLMDRD